LAASDIAFEYMVFSDAPPIGNEEARAFPLEGLLPQWLAECPAGEGSRSAR